ncbi:MAG: YjbH domain-containing protein [Glaciecola sp.]
MSDLFHLYADKYKAFSALFLLLCISSNVLAQDNNYGLSQTVRGGTGLLQTPTARMESEGKFVVNYSDIEEYRFWTASIQLFPWLQSTARYTDVRTQLYSPFENFSGDQTLKDKGIDIKLRLLEESFYLPEISVGFLDIGGTGFFSSEFIALSKRYKDFDFHIGLGTGYLGAGGNISNPFCNIADSFCNRPGGFSGSGGKVEFDQFFKGEASIFGGIEYHTPINNLTLKLEYDGNDYTQDRAGILLQDSKWNMGAVYHYNNWDVGISYQRGNTFGFNVSYTFDFENAKQIKVDRAPRSLVATTPAANIAQLNRSRLYNDLNNHANFLLHDTHIENNEMTIYGVQKAYRNADEATQRVGRILASELPESITTYKIVDTVANIPMVETIIDADAFKTSALRKKLETNIEETYIRQTPSNETVAKHEPKKPSGVLFSTDAFWIQTFGSPEDFYLYQGGAFINTGYVFNPNVSFKVGAKVVVLDNFDKFNFRVDGQTNPLPRVRTLVREYASRGNVTLENAYFHWFDKLSENTFAQVYAGQLETMFGGVGGEFLYRPVDSTLAFGFDINYVKQRDFTSELAFLDYKTVTGHANIYWRPEFLPDMQLTLNAGRFLAKDKGLNIDVAKRFKSGIIVGAYAAFTNVSAADYGEGSFTKGFYISIPFDMFSFTSSKGRGLIPWIPIGRDGGQMLSRPVKLRDVTELTSPFYD